MDRIRFWLSAQLIYLGIRIIPDPFVKESMRMGVHIGTQIAVGNLVLVPEGEEFESVKSEATYPN